MNRERKFRALKDDPSNCSFVYGQLVYDAIGRPRITEVDSSGQGLLFHTCIKDTESQYTGLKDKNGKEIYEGDIFREEKETDEGDIRSYSAVTWIRQRAAFYLVDVCHLPILEDNDCEDDAEFEWLFQDANLYDFSIDIGLPLVGNIYENPELLTK